MSSDFDHRSLLNLLTVAIDYYAESRHGRSTFDQNANNQHITSASRINQQNLPLIEHRLVDTVPQVPKRKKRRNRKRPRANVERPIKTRPHARQKKRSAPKGKTWDSYLHFLYDV